MKPDLKLSISYTHDHLLGKARELSALLNLPIDKDSKNCLHIADNHIGIQLEGFSLVYVDFSPELWKKRQGEGKKQALIRACKPKPGMNIIDLTAGWARDATLLASFGAHVLMLEKQTVMGVLIEDALQRRDPESLRQLKLSLNVIDAKDYLEQLEADDYPEVIYFDPMHPVRQKSALVKKEMQILQRLAEPDEDAVSLLKLAIKRAKNRVVVKWPQKQTPLLDPDTSIDGKTIRYDIYLAQPKFI